MPNSGSEITIIRGEKAQRIIDNVYATKVRDNERDLHLGDELRVTMTTPEGIHVMHTRDYHRGKGKSYRLKLEEIYD